MKLNPTQLRLIALSMKNELANLPDAVGSVQRILEPYALVLFSRHGSLRLHVGHRERWPDADETQPFAVAFDVPEEDMQPTGETCYVDSRVSGHIRINTMRYSWREDLTALQPAASPAPARQLTFFGQPAARRPGLGSDAQ